MNSISKASIKSKNRNVGIDVGKALLDVHILEVERHFQVSNDAYGIRELLKILGRFKLIRIIVEATGGYERNLVEALAEAAMPVIVVQPTNVRQFAKAQGILAKTDKLDAKLIALFGAKIEPEIRPISSKKVRNVRDLLARKRQLMEARTQELNRHQKAPAALQRSQNRSIKFLEKEIDWINTQLQKAVHDVAEWRQTYALLTSVLGIGDGVAYTLLGELPELGSLTNRQVAALCGLAPYNKDSGKMNGRRRIKGGCAPIRTVLYIAMICCIQHNPVIQMILRQTGRRR